MTVGHRRLFIVVAALSVLACDVSSLGIPGLRPTPTPILMPASTALPASTATFTPPPPTKTPIPAPSETFTPIPTTPSPEAGSGLSVKYDKLALLVPAGLAATTTNSTGTDVEFPYINPSNGPMPEHLRIVLNGYPVQGTVLQPQVHVFPAAHYAHYSDLTQQIITTLQTVQYFDGQPLPAGLPGGVFNAHVQSVQFANGKGIRYLTQFDEAPLPVNNREMIYYFHGLTDDGTYYVQVVLPVQAVFLAPDEKPDSSLPAGGIPFNPDDISGYIQAIANRLNATPPDQFTPALATLDALVQSIAVK